MKKLLVSFLLLMLCVVIIGCSDENGKPDSETTTTTAAESIDGNDNTVKPDLPATNFDGREFVVFARLVDSGYSDWTATDVVAEEQLGEPINDAVYMRNLTLEDRYNFKIRVVSSGSQDCYDIITRSLMANDDAYDVLVMSGANSAKVGSEGFLYDLYTLDYIDLGREYWSQNVNEALSVGGMLYHSVGDISIIDNYGIRCLYFNKDILNNLSLDDPYQLVKDGAWTLDNMETIAAQASADINGDGQMDKEDRYGMMAQTVLGTGLSIAGGVRFVGKDADDYPIIVVDDERSVTVMNRVREYVNDKANVYQSDDWQDMLIRFNNELSLFYAEVLLHIETMRGYEITIGLLPMPKYDEAQEEYYQYLDNGCCNFYSIPVTNNNPDDAAFFLEAMAAESMNTLTPAFYDICLNGKYLRDYESSEMLDIILDSYIVEFGNVFNISIFGGLGDVINRNRDVTSFIASASKRAATELEAIVDKYLS